MSEARKYPTPATNPETKPFWDAAKRGELSGWADSATGALALILLLDQFPRNMFRDHASRSGRSRFNRLSQDHIVCAVVIAFVMRV